MKQTTLQQRIEERAKEKLEKDLIDLYNSLNNHLLKVPDIIYQAERGVAYPVLYRKNEKGEYVETSIKDALYAWYHTGYEYSVRKQDARIEGWMAKAIYDYYLPQYIQEVTDEILKKIDEVDYLLESKNVQEEF